MLLMLALLIPSVSVTVCELPATFTVWGAKLREAGFATSVTLQMTVESTVAELLVSSGSRKLDPLPKSAFAVLATIEPQVAAGSSVPVMEYVTDAFAGSVTLDVLMLPVPDASQVAPLEPTQVQVAAVMATGTVSTTIGASAAPIG